MLAQEAKIIDRQANGKRMLAQEAKMESGQA